MTLRAIGVHRPADCPVRRYHGIARPASNIGEIAVHEVASLTIARPAMGRVTGVAPQAEERHRLPQQVIGHRAVRLVTMGAVLRGRRMLVHERPLLFCMALVTYSVDRIFFEVSFGLAVRVVTVGANHLAFPDRMVRRQGAETVDLRVAPVARLRFVDAHRQPFGTLDRRVTDVYYLRHLGLGVRVVAIRAGHPVLFVD